MIEFRDATLVDGAALARVYNHYIRETVVSFEEEDVSSTDMAERVDRVLATPLPWMIAHDGDHVLGYAYAGPWSPRCAYRMTAETSIYLAPEAVGAGLGTRLYGALIDRLRTSGFHSVIGGVALPNAASVALHEKLGYRKVAHYAQVGWKFGRWIDVAYWQLMLEPTDDNPSSG